MTPWSSPAPSLTSLLRVLVAAGVSLGRRIAALWGWILRGVLEVLGMGREAAPDHDWYDDVSKKTFVKLVSVLIAVAAFLGSATVSLLKDNWEIRQAHWSDAKWEAITQIGQQSAAASSAARELRALAEIQDERLDRLEAKDPSGPQLARLADQVQRLTDAVKKGKGI